MGILKANQDLLSQVEVLTSHLKEITKVSQEQMGVPVQKARTIADLLMAQVSLPVQSNQGAPIWYLSP